MSALLTPALESSQELPSNGEVLYEVVDGQRKELVPIGAYQTSIATILVAALFPFARSGKLGRVVGEMLFDLAPLNRQRRPDVAFVSYQRWPAHQAVPQTNAWKVVPDLAVEVVSPTDTMVEVLEKVREYFQASVREVWLVLPAERMAYVYRSVAMISVVTSTESLEGGDLLPGFQMPLKELFEEPVSTS